MLSIKKSLLAVTLVTAFFAIPACAYLGQATYAIEFDFQDRNTIDKIKQTMKNSDLPYLVAYEDANTKILIVLLIDSEQKDTFKNTLKSLSNTICPVKNITLVEFDNSAVCTF